MVVETATLVEVPFTNGDVDYLNDTSLMGDDRSSSLSEIDDVSESESSDEHEFRLEKPLAEHDSEAETERIEDSPHHIRSRQDILVTAGRFENTPSKLAQSTTVDNFEDDEDHDLERTPSKSRHTLRNKAMNEGADDDEEEEEEEDEDDGEEDDDEEEDDDPLEIEDAENLPLLPGITNKKRKRLQLTDDLGADIGEDGPLKKRRSSVKSDGEEDAEIAVNTGLSHEEIEEISKPVDPSPDGSPGVDDTPDAEPTVPATRGRRSKKGKRRGRKTKDTEEDTEPSANAGEAAADDGLLDDDDAGEDGEDAEADATAKSEEESECVTI